MRSIFYLLAASWLAITSLSADSVNSLFINQPLQEVPVAHQGRFRPMDAYARLWLSSFYQQQKIKKEHLPLFGVSTGSAQDFLWKVHFIGHESWDDAPLFAIADSDIRAFANLPQTTLFFSYNELKQAFFDNPKTNFQILQPLLLYHFAKLYNDPHNRSQTEKFELESLAKGLWVTFKGEDIYLLQAPPHPPWNHLSTNMLLMREGRRQLDILTNRYKAVAEEIASLLRSLQSFGQMEGSVLPSEVAFESAYKQLASLEISKGEIEQLLEMQHPLRHRLHLAAEEMRLLPGAYQPGEWFSLKALKVKQYEKKSHLVKPVNNFTLYSDALFEEIRSTYLLLDKVMQELTDIEDQELQQHQILVLKAEVRMLSEKLAEQLLEGYKSIAGKKYQETAQSSLHYPSQLQLKAELFYFQYPWIELTWVTYVLAACCFFFSFTLKKEGLFRSGIVLVSLGFLLHTFVLTLRCFILERPPVSNMFETVIYVPWISVGLSFLLYFIFKFHRVVLFMSSLLALVLFTLLKAVGMEHGLDNLQAVLNSQYWLLIHVLMVVGSYGAFLLSGLLGHLYLVHYVWKKETPTKKSLFSTQISRLILQTMYLGTALLITGTILGGVWAAESWGRFWDWDPKESWAFISSCVYLIVIHAYRFQIIHSFGLAIGSVVGLLAISFTWYGVNYILGTGLHSYGFGTGGEYLYFWFLFIEVSLILYLLFYTKKKYYIYH